MCLISYFKNKEDFFSEEDLDFNLRRNGDGVGVMYPKDGKLVVEYCMGTAKQQKAFLCKHRLIAPTSMAVHARMKTYGKINEENLHPHKISCIEDGDRKTMYLMHNGSISKHGKWNSDTSDTIDFVKTMMVPQLKVYPNLVKNEAWRKMVEEYVGSTNKLLIMDNRGKVHFFNKDQGIERDGAWHSNDYSLTGCTTRKGAYKRDDGKTWNSISGQWEVAPTYGYPKYQKQQQKKTSTVTPSGAGDTGKTNVTTTPSTAGYTRKYSAWFAGVPCTAYVYPNGRTQFFETATGVFKGSRGKDLRSATVTQLPVKTVVEVETPKEDKKTEEERYLSYLEDLALDLYIEAGGEYFRADHERYLQAKRSKKHLEHKSKTLLMWFKEIEEEEDSLSGKDTSSFQGHDVPSSDELIRNARSLTAKQLEAEIVDDVDSYRRS